jgi:hypothetical protein
MAKVKNPLFSSEASGQLGKTLAYGKWHGVDIVKTCPYPSNPRTPLQQAQRNIYGQAVGIYRETPFTLDDLSAWRRVSHLFKYKGSPYNTIVRTIIEVLKKDYEWLKMWNGRIYKVSETSVKVRIEYSDFALYNCELRSPWGRIVSQSLMDTAETPGDAFHVFGDLDIGRTYFVRIKGYSTIEDQEGWSGIYRFKQPPYETEP